MIDVNIDEIIDKIPNYEKALKVSQRSLTDAVKKAKTAVSKDVRSRYTVSAGRVREAEKVKSSPTSATVTYKSRMVNMINFKVTPKKPTNGKGRILRAGAKKGSMATYKRAFIQQVNGFGVWRRTTDKSKPIAPVYGPAISQLMNNDNTKQVFTDVAAENYEKRLEYHMMRAMR